MKKYLKSPLFVYFLSLLILTFFLFFRHQLNADEGVILNGAWNLFNKLNIYTDFFEMISPGSFYLIYLLFKVFGPSYFIANIVSLVAVWLGSIGIYKSIDLLQKNKINFLFPIFFILSLAPFPIINHNLHNTIFLIWSSYFFLLGLKNNSLKYFIISGLLSGLSIIFLQQKGLIFCAALFLFLLFFLIKDKKNIYKKIIGYSAGVLLPIFCLFLKWPPTILWKNLIIFPLQNYWEVNKTPFYLLISIFLILFYFLIFLKKKSILIKFLLFIQFFLLISTIPLPDHYHIIISIFPLLILSPLLMLDNKKIITNFLIITFILFLNIPTISYLTNTFKPFYSYKKDPQNYEWLTYIKENCSGDYLYSGPFLPNLYLETKSLNATPFGSLIERHSTEKQYEEALFHFKKNQPTCAILVYYDNIREKFKSTGNNILENYIRDNYKLEYQKNNFFIYHK